LQAAASQKKISKVLHDSKKELANVVDASINQLKECFRGWIDSDAADAPAGSDAFLSSYRVLSSFALLVKKL
jgi:hypothetical protein